MSEVPIFLNNGKNAFLPVWNGFGHDLELKTERFFNGIIMSIKFDGQTFRTRDVLQISRGAWTIRKFLKNKHKISEISFQSGPNPS